MSTDFSGGVSSYGIPVIPMGLPVTSKSKHFFVDPYGGSDGNDGLSPKRALKTLAVAYGKCTANQHDAVFLIADSGSITLSAALTWAKNYTHLLGWCAPTQAGQRARIFQLSTLTGASPLIDITATGCIFKDFYVFQGVDDATSLINVRVTGSRNYFQNIHFAGGGHATQAIDGGASLYISGGSENTFRNCTIGVDTIAAGDGMAALVYAATGGAARNRFIDCDFTLQAGNAGAIFVELLGNSGLDRYHIFRNCLFINLASQAMTQAFAVAAGFDPANKRILLKDPMMIGAGKWDDTDSGMIYGNVNAVTGADTSGVAKELKT